MAGGQCSAGTLVSHGHTTDRRSPCWRISCPNVLSNHMQSVLVRLIVCGVLNTNSRKQLMSKRMNIKWYYMILYTHILRYSCSLLLASQDNLLSGYGSEQLERDREMLQIVPELNSWTVHSATHCLKWSNLRN